MSEPNLTIKLFEELRARTRVSWKAKEKYSTAQTYFAYKSQLENQQILGENIFYELFLKATVEEIENMEFQNCAPDFVNVNTLYFIVSDCLKRFIDEELEKSENCVALYGIYLKMREEYPFMPPETDGFQDYLAERPLRRKMEQGKIDGSCCPTCGSEQITSNGNSWKCKNCSHYWRKKK